MATGRAGNLMLIDEDGENVREKAASQVERIVHIRESAGAIMKFFPDKFQKISENDGVKITRQPKNEEPIEELAFEFDKSDKKTADLLDDLKQAIAALDRAEVEGIPEDKKTDIEDLIESNKTNKDILMWHDSGKVVVVGNNYENVKRTAHELKVKVGLIKTSSRNYRGNAQVEESSSSSRYDGNTTSSSRYDGNTTSSSRYDSSTRSRSIRPSSTFEGESFNFSTDIKDFTLKIYNASITRVNVEVIVNAANESMMHGGGVARVISEAAGYELDNESQTYINRNGPLAVGQNIVTTAGNMKNYKGVIHAVGPMWHDYSEKLDCLNALYNCIWNILVTCSEKKYRSVAMSAISSGIFAVPKELCADMYVAAVTDYVAGGQGDENKYPKELHIIDIDLRILELVKLSVEKWQKDPKSVSPKAAFEKFKKDNPYSPALYTYSGTPRSNKFKGQRPRGHGQAASSTVSNVEQDFRFETSIRKLQKERFKWGGEAELYHVGKAITVKIYKGEIVKAKNMDAIVCGIDKTLQAQGFIADALKKAGGPMYQSKFQKMVDNHKGSANLSDVYKCGGGNLGVSHVMFVVSQRIVDANQSEMEAYQIAIENVLEQAFKWKFEKLVIPLFGTGQIITNTAKLRKCAVALLKALDSFVATNEKCDRIKEIHLTNNKREVNEILIEEFDVVSSSKDGNNGNNGNTHDRGSRSSSRDSGNKRDRHSPDRGSRSPDNDHSRVYSDNDSPDKTFNKYNNNSNRRKSDSSSTGRGGSVKSKSNQSLKGQGSFDSRSNPSSSGRRSSASNQPQSGLGNVIVDDDDNDANSYTGATTTKPCGNLKIFHE